MELEKIQMPKEQAKVEWKLYNELINCDSWGYNGGHMHSDNEPDNFEIIEIDGFKKVK